MSRKLFCVGLALFLLGVVAPLEAAKYVKENFDPYIKNADLVIEGHVLTQEAAPSRELASRIGPLQTAVQLGMDRSVVSKVYVSRVFKGPARRGDILNVYIGPDAPADVSNLQTKKDYLLLLDVNKSKKGYFVSRKGRAQWQLFDYDGEKKIRAWYQDGQYRPADAYQNYTDFLAKLDVCLSPVAVCELNGF